MRRKTTTSPPSTTKVANAPALKKKGTSLARASAPATGRVTATKIAPQSVIIIAPAMMIAAMNPNVFISPVSQHKSMQFATSSH